MKQKGFTPILILALVALATIGYLGYKYHWLNNLRFARSTFPVERPSPSPSPTPTPTANWKTFKTEDFSLRYPPEWQDPERYLQSTRVEYVFKPSNLSVVDGFYYNQDLQRPSTYEEEIAMNAKGAVGKQKITIAGMSTTKYIHKVGESTYEESVVLKSEKETIIWISMPLPPGTNPTLFDQILSTFKFLDQSNAEGKFCGGIAANLPENQCPSGFYCKLDGDYPDASGVCTKK